jgi:hypothetical protein
MVAFITTFSQASNVNNKVRIPLKICLVGTVYFVYFLVAVINDVNFKYLLKDMRPIILIFEVWILYEFGLKRIVGNFNANKALKLILIVALSAIVKLFLLKSNLLGSQDEFYLENSYRYLDSGTYVSSIFIVFALSKYSTKAYFNRNLWNITFVSSIFCVLLSTSRFLLLAIILTVLFLNVTSIKKTIFTIVISSILICLFVYLSYAFEAERIINALNYEGIVRQLTTRFSPFINMYQDAYWYNYVIGMGLGVPFDIPWFDYREGIDNLNVNIDSTYLTFFAKFGLVFAIIFYPILTFFKIGDENHFFNGITVLVVTMFVVSATLYQIYAIGLFYGWILVFLLINRNRYKNV